MREKKMVTGELKNKIDSLWEIFWTGGLTNPLEVIEQMTYLMFIRDLMMRIILMQRKQRCSEFLIRVFLRDKCRLVSGWLMEIS